MTQYLRRDIRNRLIEILKTLTVPTGVYVTVSDAIPPAKQDYEGFVVYVVPPTATNRFISLEQRETPSTWRVVILGTQINLSYNTVNEDNLLAVADAVAAKLHQYHRLQSPTDNSTLNGVSNAVLGAEGFRAPAPYPTGQDGNQYYVYDFTLAITFIWNKDDWQC